MKVRTRLYVVENKEYVAAKRAERYINNKEDVAATQRRYYLKTKGSRAWNNKRPEKKMLDEAKARAKQKQLPFSIVEADVDIPSHCPVLGIELRFGVGQHTDNSPSLDRVIPELGYVPGNVVVISNRANRIKNNATKEELLRIVAYIQERTS